MVNLNNKGITYIFLLFLLATSGIIIYLFITNVLNFNGGVFSKLYPKSQSFAQETIKVTTVDEMATFYGTYQSHNQKVVKNQYGIFMTHLHKDTGGDINNWRLARSIDGGSTFTTIYEATQPTRAPVIETDSAGNIYLIRPDYSAHKNYFYRFLASNNFTNPTIVEIPTLGGFLTAKYVMEMDEARNQTYYWTHQDTFTVLGLDGSIKRQFKLTTPGPNAHMHYPLLYLDENGNLYAAWTTLDNATGKIYRSIHFILSKDGGLNWEKPGGQRLTLPIIADESGPADRISLDDEFNVDSWLSGFLVKGDKVHFMYYVPSLDRQHYVRYDLATSTIDKNIYPEFKGERISLKGGDGVCVSKPLTDQIYCVNRAIPPYAIGVLRSDDNGSTWHDHAIGPTPQLEIYSLGGSPKTTDDGYLIGSFTDSANFSDNGIVKMVKFFSIPPSPNPFVIYNLASGWNSIGIPLNSSISPEQLLSKTRGKCTSSVGVNPISQKLSSYPDNGTTEEVLGSIDSGYGYLIYCNDNATFTLSGPDSGGFVKMYPGNQIITVPLSKNNILAEDFLSEIAVKEPTLNCSAVTKYDKSTSGWSIVHLIGTLENNFQMNSNEGYVLSCQSKSASSENFNALKN